MKKSNKLTAVYVVSSLLLFLTLLFGGGYGIYLSVGINFMRSNIGQPADIAEGGATSNVSYAATANFQPSMTGVIILSVVLIVISIFYFVSLIKQLVFFKQYKLIRESGLEHFIEKKIRSKGTVIFFAGLINVLAFLAGIAGIVVNINAFIDGGLSWILYAIDGVVVILAVISFVLLIKKVQIIKKHRKEIEEQLNDKRVTEKDTKSEQKVQKKNESQLDYEQNLKGDIDSVEYILLKLKNMKEGKIISNDEYDYLREKLTGLPTQKKTKKTKNSKNRKIAN